MDNTTGMFFGGGFMWIFWILLIVLIVMGLKGLSGGSNNSNSNGKDDTPLEILKKRYANGEINEEEFKKHRKELES